jgi:nucleotide-binding universal stress UspA family protein
MRLVIGVDARHRSQGAIRFAGWLRRRVGQGEVEIAPVHVLPYDALMGDLRWRHLDEALHAAQAAADGAMAEAGVGAELGPVEVVQGMTAEQQLAHEAEMHRADALVIGRAAEREGRALARLGRVARRLSRHLPAPVMIVPPDLEASHLGDGPLLCAVAPTLDALEAARTTIELAARIGRSALLLHVAELVNPLPRDGVPTAPYHELGVGELRVAKRRLEKWREAYGLHAAELDVKVGDPRQVIAARAAELRSPLVVCGSRRLDIVQRVFNSSLGTDLARHSKVPVMIVPPR